MAKMMVFSNAEDGRDDEYNTWYESTHLPDMLAIPGVVAGQRYRASAAGGPEPEHRYLAVYDLDGDAATVLKSIRDNSAAHPERMTDSIDRTSVKITVWDEI